MHNTTRRDFIGQASFATLTLAVSPNLCSALPPPAMTRSVPGATGERMAPTASSLFGPYTCQVSDNPDVTTWVQIELGSSQPIDAIRLYPSSRPHKNPSGFPVRFHIECSNDPDFKNAKRIADWSKNDFPEPADQIIEFPVHGVPVRYVKLTVTRLRPLTGKTHTEGFDDVTRRSYLQLLHGRFVFQLSKLEVLCGKSDLALHRPVFVDSILGNAEKAKQLTRSKRPQGEGLVTDNPQNVIPPERWRPVASRVRVPTTGVQMLDGLFLRTMRNNLRYLLDSFSLDEMLYDFRIRAGRLAPPLTRTRSIWDTLLSGSNAGRFLMGAGNSLRWLDHEELRNLMNAVVDGIEACQEPDGYIMGYSKDTFFYSERGAYTRAWVTHGLIDAGYAGNEKAFGLLRRYYDWYNTRDFLPQVLRGCNFGPQGTVANTRMYFTPVGIPADVQVVQRYMQENYWLADLTARKTEAIWQYPYDRPHSYIITFLEPYLDLYMATGHQPYLDAVRGGWDLFRDNWQNIGGSFSIIEGVECPPKSHFLYQKLGETCGNAFWIALNQRLHRLEPDEEKFIGEIEKSIYNVILANVDSPVGIRYYSMLVGQKTPHRHDNSCCEGQGTRIAGSLPEYIYTLAEDGLYVNLFEPSIINWKHSGDDQQLHMETNFPNEAEVRLTCRMTKPVRMKIRIRTPSWSAGPMEVKVNGQHAGMGTPGTYIALDRTWSPQDVISFVLPIALKLTRYEGVDQIDGHERYALEYGPILMAAIGGAEASLKLTGTDNPYDLISRLKRKPGPELRFSAPLIAAEWRPYYEIDRESFSCFPIIECLGRMM